MNETQSLAIGRFWLRLRSATGIADIAPGAESKGSWISGRFNFKFSFLSYSALDVSAVSVIGTSHSVGARDVPALMREYSLRSSNDSP